MAVNPSQINKMPEGDESFKKLIKQQNELLVKIYKQGEKTRKYILFGRIVNAIYLFIIIGGIILGATLLPPLVKSAVEPYQQLLNTSNNMSNIDMNSLNGQSINDLLKIFGQ